MYNKTQHICLHSLLWYEMCEQPRYQLLLESQLAIFLSYATFYSRILQPSCNRTYKWQHLLRTETQKIIYKFKITFLKQIGTNNKLFNNVFCIFQLYHMYKKYVTLHFYITPVTSTSHFCDTVLMNVSVNTPS